MTHLDDWTGDTAIEVDPMKGGHDAIASKTQIDCHACVVPVRCEEMWMKLKPKGGHS